MKSMFSRLGIPDKVVSDNGTQYTSEEFQQFSKMWRFAHVTSSLRYPQSNGKAESAVKTCKTLVRKSLAAKADFFLTLLDWRNTPTETCGRSPAQMLYGRRIRTLLPTVEKLLKSW